MATTNLPDPFYYPAEFMSRGMAWAGLGCSVLWFHCYKLYGAMVLLFNGTLKVIG